MKAFSLARTAWASWAVSSGPLEVRHRGIRIWGWDDWAQIGDIKGRDKDGR